ncbi:hypothetical protein D3876_07800 [Sphingomonas cavernae]|uniref:TfuA-like core domain-containing protein n=1 Tax=Sphingomonas cavernae TaxID=2320861 RepID=A0A418WJG3_9SPHN|nr:hypothetical protein D3876_07800 [Sphingomonas cavernae]
MRIIAFAGPSLNAAERARLPHVEWRPPAEAGDLLRLATAPPGAICLIDGYFDQRPAVRHKEILLLLSLGVRIYGASSIGALRAAEMDRHGMIGVGAIYAAYRDGTIDGDDEVALLHAPAEFDWKPLSLPLVDVRATLEAARRAEIVTEEQQIRLAGAAATIFYQDRDWAGILAAAGWRQREIGPLLRWLTGNHVAQKTLDAHACIAEALANRPQVAVYPEAVMPGFVAALAQDCGLAAMAVPPSLREIPPESHHAAPDPGRDAGT